MRRFARIKLRKLQLPAQYPAYSDQAEPLDNKFALGFKLEYRLALPASLSVTGRY